MSNNLDKKLEEILNDAYSLGAQDPDLEMYGVNDTDIAAIKQAFIDDGWQRPNMFGQVAYKTMHKDGITTIVPAQPGLMTKEEWERQAVKDGWVQTLKYGTKTVVLNGKDKLGYIVYYPAEVMTGQEWYDGFEKEFLRRIAIEEDQMPDYGKALEAAKKAAGIE